jgi:hypothetical protein
MALTANWLSEVNKRKLAVNDANGVLNAEKIIMIDQCS